MHHHSSSSGLGRKTTRRRFTKAAVLAPVTGALAATAWYAQPLLTHAQTQHALGLQQAQSASGSWSLTSPLPVARERHTATLLSNGQVLVAGGRDNNAFDQTTAYLYNPATVTWRQTGSMQTPRDTATAILLPNGQVLAVGGYRGNANDMLSSAELYDPVTGSWTPTGSMQTSRVIHTVTLLPNGQVLVVGGFSLDVNGHIAATAELYDPATGTWIPTGSMQTPRYAHTATLLPSGQVLVVGGIDSNNAGQPLTSTAELYNPATGTWTTTSSLQMILAYHTATLLNTGQVLVAGGLGSSYSALAQAGLYDPATGSWTTTGSLPTPRGIHRAILLLNGQVLVVGGHDPNGIATTAELYDSANGTWTPTGSMQTPRELDTVTLLSNGQVLVVGGIGSATPVLASAELFTPPDVTLPPPPTPPNIGGSYRGTMTSDPPNERTENVTLQITQSGSQLQGTLRMTEGTFSLSGTIDLQGTVTMTSSPNRVSLSGQTFGQGDLEGSYSTVFAKNLHGQWQVNLV